MKNFLSRLLVFLVIIGVSGCGDGDVISREGKEKAEQLARYLTNRNYEEFKSMFSEATANLNDFNEQVEEFWMFLDGEIVSYNIGGVSGVKNGLTLLDVTPEIKDIETDSGRSFTIFFQYCLINENDTSRVGVNWLVIKDVDGEMFILGDY